MNDSDRYIFHSDDYPVEFDLIFGWYFWDETWGDSHGPYETKEIAIDKFEQYCLYLDGELY